MSLNGQTGPDAFAAEFQQSLNELAAMQLKSSHEIKTEEN